MRVTICPKFWCASEMEFVIMSIYLFVGSNNSQFMVGTDYSDLVSAEGGNDIIGTGASTDVVSAGSGYDVVFAGSGNDLVRGGSGNDYIDGGMGNDFLMGGSGNDTILGGSGDDWIYGGVGDDTMSGGTGSDTFLFGANTGNDTITDFDVSEDTIDLSLLSETITFDDLTITDKEDGTGVEVTHSSLGGKITLLGVSASDLTADNFTFPTTSTDDDDDTSNDDAHVIVGSEAGTEIDAGGGDDIVMAGEGDDTVWGGDGHDVLLGEEGDDVLIGGAGDDLLIGGSGADTFVFGAGSGNDVVADYTDGEDKISIDVNGLTNIANFNDLNIFADGNDTVIDLTANGGGTIRLTNVDISELDTSDFKFYDSSTDPDGF